MLASFSLFGMTNFHRMTALKTLLAALLNGLGVAIFVIAGKIAWGPVMLMTVAGIARGWTGAWGERRSIRVGCATLLSPSPPRLPWHFS